MKIFLQEFLANQSKAYCKSLSMRFNMQYDHHYRHLTDSRVTNTVHETNNIQIYLQLIFQFWNVNVIFQQFQTVYLDQYECFRSSNFSDRFSAFLVKSPQTVRNETAQGTFMQTVRNGCNTERSGTFRSERRNAIARKVENVHTLASNTKDQLYWSVIKHVLLKFC